MWRSVHAGSPWHRGCVNSVDDCQTSRELVFKCNQGERRRRLWRWQQQILKEQLQQPWRWQVFLIDRIDVECCHLRVSEIHMRDNSCASDLRPNPSPTTTCLPATFVDVSTSQVASFLLHDLRTLASKNHVFGTEGVFFPLSPGIAVLEYSPLKIRFCFLFNLILFYRRPLSTSIDYSKPRLSSTSFYFLSIKVSTSQRHGTRLVGKLMYGKDCE